MRCMNLTFIFVFSITLMTINCQAAEPEQVHLATTGIPGEMVVQWGTEEDTALSCSSESIVEYGTENDKLNLSKIGNNNMYLWTTCTHTAILSDLIQNTTYYYRVGGEGEWSGTYSFKTLEESPAKVIIGAIAECPRNNKPHGK